MAKLYYLIASVLLFNIVSGNAIPEKSSPLKEVLGTVETAFSTLHAGFLDLLGISSNKELVDKVVTEGKAYGGQLQTLIKDLRVKAKENTGEISAAAQELITKLDTVVDKLAEDGNVKKYKDDFETNLKTVIDETKIFASNAGEVTGEVKTVLEKILNNTREVANKVVTSVSEAAKN